MIEGLPQPELEVFKELPNLKVIFDVGSRDNTEYFELYPEAELHLFEPNPAFFQNLQHLSEVPNVHLNNFGLGNEEGEFDYSQHSQAFRYGECNVREYNDVYPVKTLDGYVEERGIERIDFLKIDTEGYDFKVLLGGRKATAMTRFLQYEHWNDRAQFHALLGEDFDMEKIGYRNVLCMNRKLVDIDERNRLRKLIAERGYAALG